MSNGVDETGPIDYLVVEFPNNGMTGAGFPRLLDLVDRGIIRILDLVFVTKRDDGSVSGIAIADLDGDGDLDLAVFEGASSGLIGQDDLDEVSGALQPGSSAGLLVYENLWARRSPPRCGAVVPSSLPVAASRSKLYLPRSMRPSRRSRREISVNEPKGTTPCRVSSVESHVLPSSQEPPPRFQIASRAVRRGAGPNRTSGPSAAAASRLRRSDAGRPRPGRDGRQVGPAQAAAS